MNPKDYSEDSNKQRRRNGYRGKSKKQTDNQPPKQGKPLDPNDPEVIEACAIEWIKEIRRFFGEEDQP